MRATSSALAALRSGSPGRTPCRHTAVPHGPRQPNPLPRPPRGPALVYVTFGTVSSSVDDTGALYRAALHALRGLDVRVLVSTGTGNRPELGPVAPGVRVVEWVDQDDVLARAAVVLCHVRVRAPILGALAHGVPVVAVPLFADQPANALRSAEAGAGLMIERARTSAACGDDARRDMGTRAVRDAVGQVLADPAFRARARKIGAAMAAAPDVITVIVRG